MLSLPSRARPGRGRRGAGRDGASLRECKLAGVIFDGCDLSSVDLRGAELDDDDGDDAPSDGEARAGAPARRPPPAALAPLVGPPDAVHRSVVRTLLLAGVAAGNALTPAQHEALSDVADAFGLDASAIVRLGGKASPNELNVVGHVGERLGYGDEEVADRLPRALGVTVRPKG